MAGYKKMHFYCSSMLLPLGTELVSVMVLLMVLLMVSLPSAGSAKKGGSTTLLDTVEESTSGIKKQKVLVLNAYHEGFHWTDRIMQGVKESFEQQENVELFIHYMDAKRNADSVYFESLYLLYLHKFKNTAFDAIITTDDHALDFLLKYRARLFSEVPIVFCGINDFEPKRIQGQKNITGVYESYDVAGTIELIQSLHPSTKKVVFISDASLSGKAFDRKIKRAVPKFEPDLTFEYLTNLSPADLQERIGKIGDQTIVVWSLNIKMPDGTAITSKESIRMVAKNTRQPIYCIWDVVGNGVVGGKVTDPQYQGKRSAAIVQSILNGALASTFPVEGSPMVYKFDYAVMEQYGVVESRLPNNAIVINKPFSFYKTYRIQLYTILYAFLLLIGIVIILIFFIRKQRQIKLEISAKNEHLEITTKQLQQSNTKLTSALQIAERNSALEQANKRLRENKIIQQRLNDELKISNLTKDKFFTIIAHDLRGPFHSVLGASKVLKDNFDSLQVKEQKEFLEVIETTIQNAYKLLENLLMWSRSQSGQIEFKPEKIALTALVEETIALLAPIAKSKEIEIHLEVGATEVMVDKDMVLSIVRNIVSNAIKFTPRGGSIQITSKELETKGRQVKIKIKDNGVGIRKEACDHLFTIGESSSTRGTENETGTGIGLVLCREFVERHGGEIWVESKIGEGSSFIFTLPLG